MFKHDPIFNEYEQTTEALDDGQAVYKHKRTGKRKSEGQIMFDKFMSEIKAIPKQKEE